MTRDRGEGGGMDDAMLDRLLGSVPAPDVPQDLAARIAANVTQLPQHPPVIPVEVAPSRPRISAGRRRMAAWMGGALGTAMAAGLATLLVLPEGTHEQLADPDAPVAVPVAPEQVASAPKAPRVQEDAPRIARAEPAKAAAPSPATQPSSHAEAPPPPAPEAQPLLPPLEQLASEQPEPPAVTGDPDDLGYDTRMADGAQGTSGRSPARPPAPAEGFGFAPGSRAVPPGDGFGASAQPETPRGRRRF